MQEFSPRPLKHRLGKLPRNLAGFEAQNVWDRKHPRHAAMDRRQGHVNMLWKAVGIVWESNKMPGGKKRDHFIQSQLRALGTTPNRYEREMLGMILKDPVKFRREAFLLDRKTENVTGDE